MAIVVKESGQGGLEISMVNSHMKTFLKFASACDIRSVGKRRDGGTRYWCLAHKADATAKYGRRAKVCRAAHLPPILPEEILTLDLDQYQGGVALWGAVPPIYDTTACRWILVSMFMRGSVPVATKL